MTLQRTDTAPSRPLSPQPVDYRIEPVGPIELPKPLDVRIPNRAEQVGAFPWPERFFNRRKLPKDWENTPWLYATLREMKQNLKCPEEEDILRSLRTEENWVPDQFRLDTFLDILCGRTLQQLEEDEEGVPETKVALLIDSNNLGIEPVFRPFLGGLSARQLLREATKERYEAENESSPESSGFVEAERRLIYVVDLDAWAILALLGSSPESLYREVTECILNYLSAKSDIGVSFATEGPETFLLQLSLPVRALRKTAELKSDNRKKRSNEEPLRSSTDITFMRRFTETPIDALSIDVIYSSHMSAIVTGSDQHRWTGVAFLESWFEDVLDDEPCPDMVARYDNDKDDGLISDPLWRGKNDVMRSSWEPRSYFIRILQIRLNHVNGEWESLYFHVHKANAAALRQHKKLCQDLLLVSRSSRAKQEAERKLDECEISVKETEDVLRDLQKVLGETLSSASVFTTTHVNYFLHQDGRVGDAIDCMMPLSQIRKTLNNMSQTHRDIGELRKMCESMLGSGISARQKCILQNKMDAKSELDQRLSWWITMMSQPLLNVAAIFSCDGIITFPRTWYNFICALFLMVAAMGSIVVFLLKLVNSGVSLFELRPRGESSTEKSSDCLRERGVTALVDVNNRLSPRRSTWCTSGPDHSQRHGSDIGLLDLPGRSVLGQPAATEPSLSKPPTAILASRQVYTEPLAQRA
ncbi:hypothetical protein BDP55DRAFT_744274 [Colletotrichum godetiae]|uniref:Uncharacterized protein n=1 Tax=Colletotrichum godetiae TaxID=1209918 RepID=A0AAJ0AK96_9PEZI|nr:uncharacterized protein BDP55DRAFT_744274 [Colletotrichum godetiae]KAK1675424.1 hypothetical protein BDP55DRAFT_744274 [Colletotrichum godetiae]